MAAKHEVNFDNKELGISMEICKYELKYFRLWGFTTF